jgi:ribosomal protein L11 methyltransferase
MWAKTKRHMPETWWRLSVRIPHWVEDALVLFMWERGVNGVQVVEEEDSVCLIAYLPEEGMLHSLDANLRSYGDALEEIHGAAVIRDRQVDELQNVDWGEAWKACFHVTRVSPRFVVRPPWEDYVPPQGTLVLEIDPGQAFGTGLHETTRMCLEWIDRLVEKDLRTPPYSALDVGTGSGILAIALAKLGVSKVLALDIDPLAVEAARNNTLINHVGDRVVVLEGSTDVLAGESYLFVVANLNTGILIEMSGDLAAHVMPEGRLVISGILKEERDRVVKAFLRTGLDLIGGCLKDEWCSLAFRQKE